MSYRLLCHYMSGGYLIVKIFISYYDKSQSKLYTKAPELLRIYHYLNRKYLIYNAQSTHSIKAEMILPTANGNNLAISTITAQNPNFLIAFLKRICGFSNQIIIAITMAGNNVMIKVKTK